MKFSSLNQDIWFASDFHFNHDRDFIWGKRGFTSVAENDARILSDIQANVKPNDIMIYLGDFSLMSTDGATQGYFNAIPAKTIYYINGNHESYTKRILFDGQRLVHWGNLREISIDKQHIVLCHFPLAIWNHGGHGAYHIHGHCHGSFSESLPDAQFGRILDVGVEVALKTVNRAFFNWKEVDEILKKKSILKKDHHG